MWGKDWTGVEEDGAVVQAEGALGASGERYLFQSRCAIKTAKSEMAYLVHVHELLTLWLQVDNK